MQNFGRINETFKNILVDSIVSKDSKGKKIFNSYVKALKESKTLSAQYRIYNSIENKVETDKVKSSGYVSESISLLKELGKGAIISENAKLIKYLTKNGYKVSKDNYYYQELHENIDRLVMNKKNSKNLDKLLESKYFINNFINENTETIVEDHKIEIFPNRVVGTMMVEKFNDKYDNLTDTEKLVVKSVIRGNEKDREELYSNTILECIDLVNQQLLECTIDEKDKLLQVKDKLLRFKYNENEFISEMSKIVSLKGNLV